MNPLLNLQTRVREILRADPTLKKIPAENFLVEDGADLDVGVAKAVLESTSMAVVVTTARGDAATEARPRLKLQETLNIAIIRANTFDGPTLLDTVWAVIEAMHGCPFTPGEDPRARAFSVAGHEPVTPENGDPCTAHHVRVSVPLIC